jgi:spore germination protein GerM
VIRSSRARGLVVALLLVASAGCGVGAQSEAEPIDASEVPFGLASTPESAPISTTVPIDNAYALYFVSGSDLVAVSRGRSTPALPTAIVRALVAGPTRAEVASGMRTLLSTDLVVDEVSIKDGVAVVKLEGQFGDESDVTSRRLALAQLVFTATAIPGVDRVQIWVDGKKAEIPRSDGVLTRDPVGRADYATIPVDAG